MGGVFHNYSYICLPLTAMTLLLQLALHLYYLLFLCIECSVSIQNIGFISFLVSNFLYGTCINIKITWEMHDIQALFLHMYHYPLSVVICSDVPTLF